MRKRRLRPPPNREGASPRTDKLPDAAAVYQRQCAWCGGTFTPLNARQRTCCLDHDKKLRDSEERRRNKLSQEIKWSIIKRTTPVELVAVKKLITPAQAQSYTTREVQPVDAGYGVCSQCGGPVLEESGFGFDYCGRC